MGAQYSARRGGTTGQRLVMDSWEWNKYAAAILSALVFVLAVHFAADALFSVPPPRHPAYVPPAPEAAEPVKPADAAKPDDKPPPAK